MVNRFGINHVVVVKDEDEIVRDGGDFIEQGRQNRFGWRWLRGLEHTQHPFSNMSPQSSAKQRRGTSESVWGRYPLRPATARRSVARFPATHSLTSVVFPKPAGAEMRVSLRCRPSFSRSIRRGRLTTFGRSGGIYSFVARIGVTFSLLQRLPRSFFPSRNGATRNVEQIYAFYSSCYISIPPARAVYVVFQL